MLSVLGVLAAGIPVADTPSCAESVLADWYDDGAVQGTYDPQCYQDALAALPEDVRIYTTAVEDLSRALRVRVGEAKPSRSLSGVRRPQGREATPPVALDAGRDARRPPLPVVLFVVLLAVLAGAALARPARRARRRVP